MWWFFICFLFSTIVFLYYISINKWWIKCGTSYSINCIYLLLLLLFVMYMYIIISYLHSFLSLWFPLFEMNCFSFENIRAKQFELKKGNKQSLKPIINHSFCRHEEHEYTYIHSASALFIEPYLFVSTELRFLISSGSHPIFLPFSISSLLNTFDDHGFS